MVGHNRIGDRRLGISLLVSFVVLSGVAGGLSAWGARTEYTILGIGKRQYTVQVVSSEAARKKGLSGTAPLEKGQGMLFVFEGNDRWGIWMKDMRYPIDIVWLDESKAVVDVVEHASPASYPTVFRPKAPARYVVELSAGSAADASITVGKQAEFNVNGSGTL